jgi:hypothetical protein
VHVRLIEQNHRPGQYLGRHEEHDPRSVAYAHGVLPKSAVKPVSWTRRIPILDQGQVGSCTGNAFTGVVGTDSLGRTATTSVTVKADSKGIFSAGAHVLDESFALKGYELNTRLDSVSGQYLPDDTGSSGIACGKSGQQLGLFVSYTHAFSLDALKSALQTGAVMLGTPWLNSMFDPKGDGTIVVDQGSGVAGGHELVVSAWDGSQFRLDNSWDTSWGDAGSGYVAEADMAWLLSQGGDVTVPQFASVPQPTPTPTPTPAPVPADADKALAAAIRARRVDEDAWLKAKGL